MEMSLFSPPLTDEKKSSVTDDVITFRGTSKGTIFSSFAIFVPEEPAKHDPYSLHYLNSALLATVLEDAIKEFQTLDECNNTLHIMKVYADFNKLLGKKFGVEHIPIGDELESIDKRNLEQELYKIQKIENDRKSVMENIVKIYRDLCLNQSYAALVETVHAIVERNKYRADLVLDESKNRGLRRELAKQLRLQRNHFKSVNYDTDVVIDLLRNEIEDATLKAETRSRYAINWQIARIEQHQLAIKDKERSPAEKVEYYKQQIDNEQRIHFEVDMLVSIVTNECLEKVDYWMRKYDTDMEAADLRVQIMKNRYQNQLDDRMELEKMYANHKELMENWVEFKDERAKANAYHLKMTQSAIIVQAWWRGFLVRQELGPYKVAKKKGGGKKKK